MFTNNRIAIGGKKEQKELSASSRKVSLRRPKAYCKAYADERLLHPPAEVTLKGTT